MGSHEGLHTAEPVTLTDMDPNPTENTCLYAMVVIGQMCIRMHVHHIRQAYLTNQNPHANGDHPEGRAQGLARPRTCERPPQCPSFCRKAYRPNSQMGRCVYVCVCVWVSSNLHPSPQL